MRECSGCDQRGRAGTGHLHCRDCGNLLGVEAAGYLSVRHGGRELLCIALSIRCEDCGAVWRPPDETIRRVVRPLDDELVRAAS